MERINRAIQESDDLGRADSAERRRAEHELRETEERFRILAESSLTGVCLIQDDRFRYVNPAMARMFGYSVEEVVDRLGHRDLVHPADRAVAAENLRRRLEGEAEEVRYQFRGLRKDGSSFPVEVHGRRIEHAGKIGVMGTLLDNTERQRVEDELHELRASEARFRTFVDQATDAFFLHDDQLRIVDVNRQACVSLGYSREELIGMHPHDFDVGLDEASIERLRRRIVAGETSTFETRHRRKDGTVFPVEIRAVQFEQGGGPPRHLSLARDVTERKQAEEALRRRENKIRRLVEANIIGIYFWHAEGPILDANDEFLRIVGYDREDLDSGRLSWIEISPPEWRARIPAQIAELKRTRTVPPYEKDYIRKDGARVTVLICDSSFDETAKHGVCFALDLTERNRAAKALREMQSELAQANRVATMGQLTASIAHEVNQPIGATLTNAEAALRWLRAEQPNLDEVRQALDRIVRGANRAADVVARMRSLFRKAPPRGDRLEINAAIREVIEFARNEALKNSVSVKTQFVEGLPLLRGDRVELQQVILNLILNAVEAMSGSEEPRELLIKTGRNEAGDALVVVGDTGPGLARAVQENLFKAFYTTKPSGLGLGLSICRSIVEAHGGQLWANANAPRGAVFQFTLPAESDTLSQE